MLQNPLPLAKAVKKDLSKIKALFFDIDDTFSSLTIKGSKILPQAFDALWKLYNSGIYVVPVTGRPAGWCDHIARMWPVHAVVGENGAFYSFMQDKLVKKYTEQENIRKNNLQKLENLKKNLYKKFPFIKTPSDQFYREFDFAVDFCEDVPRLKKSKIYELINFAENQGAHVKLSSIHINIWYGEYDKWTCVEKVLKECFSMDPKKNLDQVAYIGDSPNDEPFFEKSLFSVGVANIEKFLPDLKFKPKYITKQPSGLGFTEFAKVLLSK